MKTRGYKKVINKKVYNTATAELLGVWNYNNQSDSKYILEKLYITKKRQYFLHGEGGAWTEYATNNFDNCCSWGETIIPFSRIDAYEWAEKREQLELIETHFKDEIDEA